MYPFSIYPFLNRPAQATTPRPDQHLVESSYLDARFLAMEPEYEAMLRGVGLERGWRVLDAGCGGGSHLRLLSELLGPRGRIHALDQIEKNIAVVERLGQSGELACRLDTHYASVLDLPLADGSVDAVWNANVSQYLTDDDLRTMLREFRRVTRPGGIVAIKEIDGSLFQIQPISPRLIWNLFEAAARNDVRQLMGTLRAPLLPQLMRDVGFANITVTPTPIVRRAPLRSVERQAMHEILHMLVHFAERANLPASQLRQWRAYADEHGPAYVLNHPDLCWCETQTVITGRVPEE